jgi:hypothetical protein
VFVERKVPENPDTTFPLWERPGNVHYCRVGDGMILAPLTYGLIDDFKADAEDPCYVQACAALGNDNAGAPAVAWIQPQSDAERGGIEPLLMLMSINNHPTPTMDALANVLKDLSSQRLGKRKRFLKLAFNNHVTATLPQDRMETTVYV